MAVAGKVLRELVYFSAYLVVALTVLFPRIPDDRPDGFREVLILLAALVAIGFAVRSTVDWILDTVREAVTRKRRKHDNSNGSAGDATPGDDG